MTVSDSLTGRPGNMPVTQAPSRISLARLRLAAPGPESTQCRLRRTRDSEARRGPQSRVVTEAAPGRAPTGSITGTGRMAFKFNQARGGGEPGPPAAAATH